MCNRNHCTLFECILEGLLNLAVGLSVYGSCGLIQEQYLKQEY